MNDSGGHGQQLVIRREVYFPTAGDIDLNIRLFTRIFRQTYCALLCGISSVRGILAIPYGTLPSGWMPEPGRRAACR